MNKDIKQADFASTLMSSVKFAYNHFYNKDLEDFMYFGLSGHAFASNTTNGLGPCAPYNWDMKIFNQLTKDNLGISVFNELGMLTIESSEEQKKELTQKIKESIDEGNVILLGSYEHQVIYGYNDTHLLVSTPWDDVASVTPNLELNTFKGMKDFALFFEVKKSNKKDLKNGIIQSLQYAVSLFDNPSSTPDSAEGIKSLDFWLEKVNDENAVAHGNWWTSSVWAESRNMASLYINTIYPYIEDEESLKEISKLYLKSSKLYKQIANRDESKDVKIILVKELKDNEIVISKLLKKVLS